MALIEKRAGIFNTYFKVLTPPSQGNGSIERNMRVGLAG
jgi:hypothetical protein